MPIPAGATKRIRAGLMASFEQNSSVSLASRSVDRKRNETTFCTSECHRPERSAVARTIDPDRDSIDGLKLIIIIIIVTIGAHYKSAGVGQTFNCTDCERDELITYIKCKVDIYARYISVYFYQFILARNTSMQSQKTLRRFKIF